MSYKFQVQPHSILQNQPMVEVWRDGSFVAGIYPHKDGIRIVSKYLIGVEREHQPFLNKDGTPLPTAIIKLSD